MRVPETNVLFSCLNCEKLFQVCFEIGWNCYAYGSLFDVVNPVQFVCVVICLWSGENPKVLTASDESLFMKEVHQLLVLNISNII